MVKESEKPKLTDEEAKALRKKYGIPDWKQKENYDYIKIKKLTKEQIRWEFLRRDPAYRGAWERNKSGSGFGLSKFIDPKVRSDDPLLKDFKLNDTKYRGMPLWLCLQPPNIRKILSLPPDEQENYVNWYYGKQQADLVESGYFFMVFDPHQPIPPQLIEAEKWLEEVQEETERPDIVVKKKKYPQNPGRLLRLLDGRFEGWPFWRMIWKIDRDDEAYKDPKEKFDQQADDIGRDLHKTGILYWRKY
jgi:hypothetical protein